MENVLARTEAYRVGSVNQGVPLPELNPLAQAYARRLAAPPLRAVRMAKESPKKGLDSASLEEAAQADTNRFMLPGQTEGRTRRIKLGGSGENPYS